MGKKARARYPGEGSTWADFRAPVLEAWRRITYARIGLDRPAATKGGKRNG